MPRQEIYSQIPLLAKFITCKFIQPVIDRSSSASSPQQVESYA